MITTCDRVMPLPAIYATIKYPLISVIIRPSRDTEFPHIIWLTSNISHSFIFVFLTIGLALGYTDVRYVYGLLRSRNNPLIRIKTLTYIRLFGGDAIS